MGKKKIIKIFNKSFNNFSKKYKILEKDFTEKNIHDFRVAYRRLNSVYKVLQISGFDSNKKLKQRTKKIFYVLGEMRDYQVNLNLLENMYFSKEIPEEISEKITKSLEEDREKLIKKIKENRKEIFRRLKKDQKKIQKYIKDKKKEDLISILRKINDDLRGNVERAFFQLSEDIETYHNLRLEVKKYRYFLENFGDILNNDKEKYKRLKSIQDFLGEINDLDVLDRNLNSLNVAKDEELLKFLHARLQNKINEFRIIF
jgi:CHAD domain-containing protein